MKPAWMPTYVAVIWAIAFLLIVLLGIVTSAQS